MQKRLLKIPFYRIIIIYMIYLVEDDLNILELVVYTLNSVGLQAQGFSLPSLFKKALQKELPTLILLDIMLPEEDGLTILKGLKNNPETSDIPVIMLTAKGSEIDKVKGLDLGADDYISKPFGMMELVARVKARLRVTKTSETPVEYKNGNLTVCPKKRSVYVSGEEIALTLKEFDILCYLLENEGLVLTRDQILNKIWGYSFDGENRTVDVHIRTLRTKLGEEGKKIETVRGVGYRIGKSL